MVLIQACQGSDVQLITDNLADARRGAPNKREDEHIVLRIHTRYLLATVAGKQADRGLYTGAMAEQLKKVDGSTDIYNMHSKAIYAMRWNKPECRQEPEYRDTLSGKKLILPHNKPGRLLS